MKSSCAFVVLLLVSGAMPQDAPPIDLSGPNRTVPTCRGKQSDAPGCVTPPHATFQPDPDYPDKARRKKQRGTVLVGLIVGTDGLPREVRVDHSATPELDGAAVDTVKRWRFTPASKDGKPVAAQIKVEVSFKLY